MGCHRLLRFLPGKLHPNNVVMAQIHQRERHVLTDWLEGFGLFTTEYDVGCDFCLYSLYYVEIYSLSNFFDESFLL